MNFIQFSNDNDFSSTLNINNTKLSFLSSTGSDVPLFLSSTHSNLNVFIENVLIQNCSSGSNFFLWGFIYYLFF